MTQPSLHSVSVAAVITDPLGRILVIQRRDNSQWQLPGGVLELDETIDAGVAREIREETGVEVRPTRLTGVYKNMKLGVLALVLRAEVISGEPRPTDESVDVAWWNTEQVTEGQPAAFAIRVFDALRDEPIPAIRHHDGVNLL
jgi:8-oxo-dGTP diphosphatase